MFLLLQHGKVIRFNSSLINGIIGTAASSLRPQEKLCWEYLEFQTSQAIMHGSTEQLIKLRPQVMLIGYWNTHEIAIKCENVELARKARPNPYSSPLPQPFASLWRSTGNLRFRSAFPIGLHGMTSKGQGGEGLYWLAMVPVTSMGEAPFQATGLASSGYTT